MRAENVDVLKPFLCDTVQLLNGTLEDGEIVLAEGTQGYGLSIDHGVFPFVTSRDTTVSALASSLGLSLHACAVDVIGVARSYPIRVAGNSGPFPEDSIELTWEELSRRAGSPSDIIERTSVTKLVRRVATFSWNQLKESCRVNRPTEIALTFADYLDWSIHGSERLSAPISDFIDEIEKAVQIPVTLVKTGPQSIIDCERYRKAIRRKIA